jgi:Flp pilus assembly pilin Flp
LATTERRRKEMLQKFFAKMQKEGGQGLTEYALILVLVSVAMVIGLTALQGGINNAYTAVITALTPTP